MGHRSRNYKAQAPDPNAHPTQRTVSQNRGRGRNKKGDATLTVKQAKYIKNQLDKQRPYKPTQWELARRFKVSRSMIRHIAHCEYYLGESLMTQPETKFKEKVQKDLDKLGIWHVKVDQRALRGIPDMILCIDGLFIAIELKKSYAAARSNAPRHKLQRWVREEIRKKGKGIAFLAYPENWNEVYAKIKQLAKGEDYDKDYLWPAD